jgi:hypothetical protein
VQQPGGWQLIAEKNVTPTQAGVNSSVYNTHPDRYNLPVTVLEIAWRTLGLTAAPGRGCAEPVACSLVVAGGREGSIEQPAGCIVRCTHCTSHNGVNYYYLAGALRPLRAAGLAAGDGLDLWAGPPGSRQLRLVWTRRQAAAGGRGV